MLQNPGWWLRQVQLVEEGPQAGEDKQPMGYPAKRAQIAFPR